MPTSTSGTSYCSAAIADANSHVSRTIRSGRHSSVTASMPGNAARASRPTNSSRITNGAPGPSPENTGAQAAERPCGSPTPRNANPARSTMRRGRVRSGHEDLVTGALVGAGEGDERAEVTAALTGREQNAHMGSRRTRRRRYSP